MESRADDPKLAEAPATVFEEVGTLVNRVEKQVVVGLPASESYPTTPVRVVEQVTPVVGQRTNGKKRERPPKSLTSKLHSAPKMMKEEEEEVCFICFDGGYLVLCDRKCCPKAYHPACIKRDEAFFKSTAKWVCGWHICSVCQKAAHYMCYTCPYSICKKCTKNTDYVCVRENKGFCLICMKTIMMIETKDAGNKETIQVDFDDKTSWEYLFKIYWNLLKNKLSLSLDELTQAKNPCIEVIETYFTPQIQEMNNSVEGVAVKQTLHDEHEFPDQSSFSAEKPSLDKRKNSDICSDWGSKELMEFVGDMKNGDTSVLSQSDVQALLMEYIKKNNLRDPKLKSQIICDLRLKLLFGKPSVGHIEMVKLLEHHYLIKEDTQKNARLVGDVHNEDFVSSRTKRQKTIAPEVNLNEYAAIDAHNINLIFLRRSAVENLIDEEEMFHDKAVGSIVRIRVSCNDQKQYFYRLVRVVGTSKGADAYKVGDKTTNIMLQVLNLDKKETLSIDATSNQVFTEEECKRLHESIKCGIVKPLTVGEIQLKAMALQALRFDDWLIAEILRLSHLRDKANEKGHKKEHKECVEKLKLLRTPEVRHQKLTEIPEVHADPKMIPNHQSEDPKMNPNHQSEGNASKTKKQKDEVSKLGINGNHTLPPRKCVKDNEATGAQGVQQKESNSSLNCSLRPRKSVKENKTTCAERVQPKRGKGGSNSFPKQENHVSTCGSSSVLGNQSVPKDSETPTVGLVSTIQVQPKRDGGRLNKILKQENQVLPDGSSNVVSNQSVPSPDSKFAIEGSVSTIRVQHKRDGGRSIKIPNQENQVLHDGTLSFLSPDSKSATVGSVSTIQVQPKREGGRSNKIPMQGNQVLPCGSLCVAHSQSVPNPDSETAMVVGPVSTIRVQPKRGKSGSNGVPKQENHVSHGGSASVLGNQSVMSSGSVTSMVGPVSRIRVQPKRGKDMSKSSPKIKKHVSSDGNQSILRPDSNTATVDAVTIIEANQKNDGGGSNTFPKQENHVSLGVVNNQSMLNPNLETAVGPVSKTQQKSDVGGSNTFLKLENGGSSTVMGNQSVPRPDSEIATVGPVIGTLIPTSDAQMEKLWHYRDPNRKVQGPFSMLQLQKWSTTGYFPVDMKIWTDNEQDHSVLLTDALNGDFCSAHALNKEKQSEVDRCFDLLKNVPDSSEHIVVDKNILEHTYEDSLNRVSKPGVEDLIDAGANVHLNKSAQLDLPDISSKDASLNKHLNEAPQLNSPDIESTDTSVNEHPDEALLYDSPSIESKDAGVNEHPNEAPPYNDAGVNKHPNEAPPYNDAGVNEHPNEAPPYDSPRIECKDATGVNEHPNKALLLDLDLNNKDCNQASSLTNQTESPENKTDLDIVNLPSPLTAKTDNNNSENQTNELDSMSIDIQAAELLRSLSGYVPDDDMTVLDTQTPANNTDDDPCIPVQKLSEKNQLVDESDNGPCASSQVVGCGDQIQEIITGVWVGSPARDVPLCKEWDFGLVPMSSDAVGGDHVATITPNGNRNLLLDLSSWPVSIDEPIEFNTLAEESVSDLLAEVDAMESKSCLPSPSSIMRCGDDLVDRNDCFSSIEELSPNPDAGKSDAVSSDPEIRFLSHPTEIHDHVPIRASRVSSFDPLKRSTGCETKSVGYPINIWEPGPDIHPPPPGTSVNQQQPMISAPNHVWGGIQGSVNLGWAGPPPPQAFGNVSWRPNIGTTPPWVDSNLSLGAYNGNGGWDNSPHRFGGSRDYAFQGGDTGFGRGGSRPTWSRQQHGGGGGGYSRSFLKGQRVCKFYESGHCKKGAACGYLHP